MTNSNTVVVLPAFETAPQKNMTLAHQLADTAAMMNKAQLGRLVQKKLIYQFALYLFRQVCGCSGCAGCAGWLYSTVRQAQQSSRTEAGTTGRHNESAGESESSCRDCSGRRSGRRSAVGTAPLCSRLRVSPLLSTESGHRQQQQHGAQPTCTLSRTAALLLLLLLQGHNCTDYAKWFQSSQPYDVEYHDGYEPWFIIDRFRNPWYDVSFRGYGWNKVSHVLNIFYKK